MSSFCDAGTGYNWLSEGEKVNTGWKADWGCIVNIQPAIEMIEESSLISIALAKYDTHAIISLMAANYYCCLEDDWITDLFGVCIEDMRKNLGETFTPEEEKETASNLEAEMAELWETIKRCAARAMGSEEANFQFAFWLNPTHMVIESLYGTSKDIDENNPYRSPDGHTDREPAPLGVARGSLFRFPRTPGISERPYAAEPFRQPNRGSAALRRPLSV